VKKTVRRIAFETHLDQPEALARLARPGTLAVMPSFAETFGNTVRECLDYGIPFVASDAAAICELIAPEDRPRVLFEPTARGVEAALRQALAGPEAVRPARAAFDAADSFAAWAKVMETPPQTRARAEAEPSPVDVVVVQRHSDDSLARCLAGLTRQSHPNFGVIVASTAGAEGALPEINGRPPLVVRCEGASVQDARQRALAAASAPFVLFLDEDDGPQPELLATLVRAQNVSGADVVSCALRLRDEAGPALHFFHGQPGGLGLLANGYGTVALLRRSLFHQPTTRWPVESDGDWLLLAGLSVAGAQIVSVPAPLVTRSVRPGSLERQPSDALLVAEQLDHALPDALRSLARLAAGLAAAANSRPISTSRRRRRGALRRVVRGKR
jgi:Glycosyl transferase family 2/Glycosyl transferases group 1